MSMYDISLKRSDTSTEKTEKSCYGWAVTVSDGGHFVPIVRLR